MAAAASAVIELLAKTGSFETDIKRAEATMKRLDRTARGSGKGVSVFNDTLSRAANAATFIEGPLNGIASRFNIVAAAARAGQLEILALGSGLGALTLGLGAAIRNSEKFERLTLRTEAVIKATGQSAGLTATDIREFSESLAASTLASVEGVEVAAQKLLTFRSIAGDTFKETLKLSQDLAALGFGSIETASVQLGKALEDPVNGLSSLRRIGVSFSETQREQIKNFVETNRLAEAQGVILEALRQQVGGAGTAEAGGLAGAFDTLGQNVEKFLTNIGDSGPIDVATAAVQRLANTIATLNEALFPSGQNKFNDLVAERLRLQDLLKQQESVKAIPLVPDIAVDTLFGDETRAKLSQVESELESLTKARENELRAQNAAANASEKASKEREKEISQSASLVKSHGARASAANALEKQRKSLIESLQKELDLLGATKPEIVAYELAALGASDAEIKLAQSIREQIDTIEERNKLLKEGVSVTESFQTPQEKHDSSVNKLGELKNVGAIDETTFTRGLDAANQALEDYNAQQAEAIKTARDQLYEGLRTEEEAIAESYERRKEAILAATEVTETERQDLLSKLESKYQTDRVDRETQGTQSILDANAQLFEGLAGLAKSAQGEQSTAYRVLFGIQKAFSLASSALALSSALVKALDAPYPANLAAIAEVAAIGGNLVAQVAGASYAGGRADGGPVSPTHRYLVGERGPEMFVPNTQGTIIPNNLLGKQEPPVVNVRNINAFDPSVLGDYLGSDSGERVVMNIIQRNAQSVRSVVSA